MAVAVPAAMLETRENKTKNNKTKEKCDKKVLAVAQEIKIARALAGNNKQTRDRALKSLKKWFSSRSKTIPFTEDDLMRIWKGLFYSMWMSDKPLVQEECAENIAGLIHHLSVDSGLLFFKCGITTLQNEWIGIDQLRLDKFLMLTRRLLRQTFFVLKNANWKKNHIEEFNIVLGQSILHIQNNVPLGLFLQFTEIYLEELAKVSNGDIKSERVTELLKPFISVMAYSREPRKIGHIRTYIFQYLIKQSDSGLEYREKYEAWKQLGFPGNINSMQKVAPKENDQDNDSEEVIEDETEVDNSKNRPMDPRAGRVDVELPQIPFKAKAIANELLNFKFMEGTTTKSRKAVTLLAENFKKLETGIYPLGAKELKLPKDECDTNIRKAVNRLVKFEKKLMGNKDKKKNKKRKNTLVNPEDGPKEAKQPKFDLGSDEDLDLDPQNAKLVPELGSLTDEDIDSKLKEFTQNSEEGINFEKLSNKKRKKNKQTNGSDLTLFTNKKQKTTSEDNIFNTDTPIKKKVKKPKAPVPDYAQYAFKRNSGTWFVFETPENDPLNRSNVDLGDFLGAKLATIEEEFSPSTSSKKVKLSPNKSPNKSPKKSPSNSPSKNGLSSTNLGISSAVSPNEKVANVGAAKESPISVVKLFGSPKENLSKEKELFPKPSWDSPLQEGEYEITIPTKKHVEKMKKLAMQTNQNVQDLINSSLKLNNKGRFSLDARMLNSTPIRAKKVKINTKLNKSQEIYEHHEQILSSPAIPYDANKKPSKPLLKTGVISSPINPFYKRLSGVKKGIF